MHSDSNGEAFTVRSETLHDYVRVECEDLGGPWHCARPGDRPHGLDIIQGAPMLKHARRSSGPDQESRNGCLLGG